MYNEELEYLIDLALVDGVLTDKEKTVLFKKAKALGLDKGEFELVLNGKLHLGKQLESKNRVSVIKCTSCGEAIKSFELICSSCGIELRSVIANKSISNLTEELHKITVMCENKSYSVDGGHIYMQRAAEVGRLQSQVIRNIQIPNTREDLISFLYFVGPKAKFQKGAEQYKILMAWRSKFDEIYSKIKFMIKDKEDSQTFEKFYLYVKQTNFWQLFWYGTSIGAKIGIFVVLFYVILFTFAGLFG